MGGDARSGYQNAPEARNVPPEEEREKRITRLCLRNLAFFQMWLGSCLFIVGIALSAEYGLYYLAVLIDGLATAFSAALGGTAVYYPENRCLYFLRKATSLIQAVCGVALVIFYIWCAVEVHVPFVAFMIFEIIQVALSFTVFFIYMNWLYPTNLCCVQCMYDGTTTDIQSTAQHRTDDGRDGNTVGAEQRHQTPSNPTDPPPIYEYISNGQPMQVNAPPPAYEYNYTNGQLS